ncbi:PEP-CTERM sorting domain-containing protein [Hydrogenophaga sp. PBL-H3]|uniref:PEP-CTERM sorting domain-containing protein n=1 Tax=Hydrogenophaga sp. PBL-H3 TaxID=434010 RepID=UPI00131FBB50|nr:PEP-CTERM sorting domain-containing protein [Hydrogenophaga sp. PBL-H3]QHE77683.1 PEP-CTERM sorting domain-containing protein [Hydrogenophaga sp. PBL-H3]QHE82107.1 PEP-CTERM sorting domain-containing protein [Hydrogenophaga sp. PBL-H3]
MNILFKAASGAVLSAVTLSVAALSVPSIKAQALKLIEAFPTVQALVKQVTLDLKVVWGAEALGESVGLAVSDLDLGGLLSVADENAAGVANVYAGVVAAGMSSNLDAAQGGSGLIRLDGIPAASGLVVAGPGTGGLGNNPAGSGVPLVEAIAPDEIVSLARDADAPSLPGGVGPQVLAPEEIASGAPENDIFEDVAALPLLPSDDFGMKPDGDLVLVAAAPSLAALSEIPEPGTLALLGVALFGWGAFRRQRTHR